jgi:hypothetical protein
VGHEFAPPKLALHPSLHRTKLCSSLAPWKEGETPKLKYWAKSPLGISKKESNEYVSISVCVMPPHTAKDAGEKDFLETLPVHKKNIALGNHKRNTVSSGFNFLLVYYGSSNGFQKLSNITGIIPKFHIIRLIKKDIGIPSPKHIFGISN